MLRYISHLSFSTRATLHLTLSPPPPELRGDFLFLSFVRVRVLISSFLPIQLGRKSKSDLVLQLNAKELQRRSQAKKRRVEKRWSAKKPDARPQKDQSSASTTVASLEAQQP
ncbi:hypothetical protein CKAN_01156700 [Cinnamomum micranthum f. kanehirae]|uniref:Uncharacterized protein n=1 Tax=Cinnamomum micranthum f. kanehirae TaxID=337451 RepID=A0A3S3QD66_9MAGN|nr:hypothetical protein CKAN_01156700 [Cinnamomum micranthum f. kanehirae]